MTNRLLLALACVLLAVRLPSLAQPMGADQGLYAYVGEGVRSGELPYRDAWDQKPPAIHLTYGLMRAILPRDAAVPAADLLIAAVVAALLWQLGGVLAAGSVGAWAAIVFLALSNPAFARLGGVSLRAQCETFIAAAVTGAFLCLARSRDGKNPVRSLVIAGALFGLAFTFKYNAAAYALAGVAWLFAWKRATPRAVAILAGGFLLPIAAFAIWFAAGHALGDLYDATILYNVRYSGETYQGPLHATAYLLTFPIRHARVDALWLVGGGGCAVLLVASWWRRDGLITVAWVAAACLSIAINGSRELPQYFVQAAPALALAAAWGGSRLRTPWRVVNLGLVGIVAIGIWRVNDFSKLVDNTRHDARYALGRMTRTDHLARYGDRATRKYSALAMDELGTFLRSHSQPADAVYVFGFSSGAYVAADRRSASRFFWSRPVIVGFNDGKPGYGVSGLLEDLRRSSPAIVALQQRDWYPDVDDSAHFFMTTPTLADWLRVSYDRVAATEGFDVWIKRTSAP
jgi:4-amino-4-deoxy-L-arabinose transferase-like glycosyltransferase